MSAIWLQKVEQVINPYGDPVTVFKLEIGSPVFGSTSDTMYYPVDIAAYKDLAAYGLYKPSDNYKPTMTNKGYLITDAETIAQGGVDTPPKDKIVLAVVAKITESILDEEGKETNLFQGNIGSIGFQDATLLV